MSALTLAAAPRARPGTYLALWLLGLRQRLSEPVVALGAAGTYVLLLCVYARLSRVLFAHEPGGAAHADAYVWYIAITEWILCAHPRFHLDIEQDVRTGDVAYHLTRPTSYLGVRLADAVAQQAANLALLGLVGFGVACMLVGPPADLRGLLVALPLALLASLLWTLCSMLIGLSAFWVQDTAPFFWIFQKAAFVLGGLLLPLDLYPDWLRAVALALPFSALLYLPARSVFAFDLQQALLGGLQLALYCGLALLALRFVFRRALRVLDLNGG